MTSIQHDLNVKSFWRSFYNFHLKTQLILRNFKVVFFKIYRDYVRTFIFSQTTTRWTQTKIRDLCFRLKMEIFGDRSLFHRCHSFQEYINCEKLESFSGFLSIVIWQNKNVWSIKQENWLKYLQISNRRKNRF